MSTKPSIQSLLLDKELFVATMETLRAKLRENEKELENILKV